MSEARTVRHEFGGAPVRALKIDVIQGPDAPKSLTASTDTISIGSAQDNDLVLSDETVSRYHAELLRAKDQIRVADLGSTNGVVVGKASIERGVLSPGAQIRLGRTVLRIDEGGTIPVDLHDSDDFYGLRGRSEEMRKLMVRLARAARSDVSVLLLGETGVGKEVVASALHRGSGRANGPYETVDCGTLAPTLIASELFGHEKGAFTGADRQHIGAFERANGGTLFLDEIGELPSSLQTSLLGALERRQFRRVGGDRPISVDVRLVCATNRDLRSEVNAGRFREDLYFRIAVVRVAIPALRDRPEDIPLLIEHFLREAGHSEEVADIVPPEVMDELSTYRWPGNVRELRNFIEAAMAMGEAELDRFDEPEDRAEPKAQNTEGFPSVSLAELYKKTYREARDLVVDEFESKYLKQLLDRAKGNVSQAARLGEIHRTYLIRMLERHRLR